MSTWMKNLRTDLENKEVVILHGNVRDKYINPSNGAVYGNLTELLQYLSRDLPIEFTRSVFYDIVGNERQSRESSPRESRPVESDPELGGTSPTASSQQNTPPTRVMAKWERDLSSRKESCFATIYYLDKLIPYKASYQSDEREILLRLEKLIENITPNNRLVMVALQETMVPVELTTNAPKVSLLQIPAPDKEDRQKYLAHRMGDSYEHVELVANLTDGLFMRDLDNLIQNLNESRDVSSQEIRRRINKYRIGEQADYWGSLDLKKLSAAQRWFVEKEGVKGQDDAVRKVVQVMTLARAGLSGMASGTPSKPKGILFFAGPTGVGKTFLAKKLAKFLFDSEEAFIRFDMSEFKEEHTESKLIGSPPGYVGYERGGLLTGAVRERPFSVILFDEIEKAHPKILDIFLQILDDGRLTDSRGQTVFFTETVIIFTSNIGTRTRDSQGKEINEREALDVIISKDSLDESRRRQRIHEHFTSAARNFFMFEISRPELLNRIGDNIVPFNFIDNVEMQREIVASHFARIQREFQDQFRLVGHTLEFADSASALIVIKHTETIASFGGRGITNAIQDEMMKPLSIEVLRAELNRLQGVKFRVFASNNHIEVKPA